MRRKAKVPLIIVMFLVSACNLGRTNETLNGGAGSTTEEPAEAVATAEPTIVLTPTVEHKTKPGEFPESPSGTVGDQDSSITADDNRAPGGDRFTFTRFERPFNSQTMDEYYPYIDIQEGALYVDNTWIYVSIVLKSDESSRELNGKYGIEIDYDLDGNGDWLILATDPVSQEWSTTGVEVWFDTNEDVGGENPATSDEHPAPGNGYETLEFGNGVGDDPDLAWVRVSGEAMNVVQLAIKIDVLKGSGRFLAGLWSGEKSLDPSLFDLSDHYTHEQAGAALVELDVFYPIKEVAAIDNTCRMAVGFQPTGNEPGLCPLPGTVAGEEYVDPGCPSDHLVCRQPQTYVGPEICTCKP